jgi:predicted nucleotidyltransferase
MPSQDYEEFIAALNAHGVRYLVIGAHAVAFHARPRATKDLDILVDPTAENAHRVLAALREFFGGADLNYTVEDLIDPQWIIQLGVAPVRIDLLSEIPGFANFEGAWKNRVDAQFGAVKAHYLGLDDLIQAKEAAGRPQDRADVRVLRRAKGQGQLTKRSSERSPRSRR